MVLDLPTELLKTDFGLVLVPRCEPSTYLPYSWWFHNSTIEVKQLVSPLDSTTSHYTVGLL